MAVPELSVGAAPRTRGRDDARLLGLDAQGAAALMTAADAHSPRMAALIATLLTTGARISEALDLTPARLRAGAGGRVTTTITGKGGRMRTVVVPPPACAGTPRRHPPRQPRWAVLRDTYRKGLDTARSPRHPHPAWPPARPAPPPSPAAPLRRVHQPRARREHRSRARHARPRLALDYSALRPGRRHPRRVAGLQPRRRCRTPHDQ